MTGIGNLVEKEMTNFNKFWMFQKNPKIVENSTSIQMMQNTKKFTVKNTKNTKNCVP